MSQTIIQKMTECGFDRDLIDATGSLLLDDLDDYKYYNLEDDFGVKQCFALIDSAKPLFEALYAVDCNKGQAVWVALLEAMSTILLG